jgi:hypothetical protein
MMMVISMWVNGKIVILMVKAHLLMLLVIIMWVSGKIVEDMVKER